MNYRIDYPTLVEQLRQQAKALGFHSLHISPATIDQDDHHLRSWLNNRYHGEMAYMENHADLRSKPDKLLPDTQRVISCLMNYRPAVQSKTILENDQKAYISRYALGRDYHKLMRKRLAKLANVIENATGSNVHRAFVDSAPVLERALAQQAGHGWIGKNTLLMNSSSGSWFFLGEIFTDVPLPIDPQQTTQHCGSCRRCLDNCPTQAFVKSWVLDARRCISYLTIELKGSIPVELRPLIGNRVFGCDDCQLVCPWNKFASYTEEPDFQPRHRLDDRELVDLFLWDEKQFLNYTQGSAIRRIGHERWLRNLAVALGNAQSKPNIIAALQHRTIHSSALVREHVAWALQRHGTQV